MSKRIVLDSCFQREIPYDMLDLANYQTPSELKKNVGKNLTEMFFKTCSPFERVLYGLPPLNCDGTSCARNKMPIKSADDIQALTHQGILEIGEQLEKKFEQVRKEENEKAMQEMKEFLEFECNLRVKFHVKNERKTQEEIRKQELQELKIQHEKELGEMKQLYEEAISLLKEFSLKKNQLENKKHLEKIDEPKLESPEHSEFLEKFRSSVRSGNFVPKIRKLFADFPDDDEKLEILIKKEVLDIIEDCESDDKADLSQDPKQHLKKLAGKKTL